MWEIIGLCIAALIVLWLVHLAVDAILPDQWQRSIEELFHYAKFVIIGYFAGEAFVVSSDTTIDLNSAQVIGVVIGIVYHYLAWEIKTLRRDLNLD